MPSKEQAHSVEKTKARQHSPQSPQPSQLNLVSPSAALAETLQRAGDDPASLNPRDVLHLQRAIGNRAVSGLLNKPLHNARPMLSLHHGVIQTKLTVGAANDSYEQEADRVADQVLNMPGLVSAPPAAIQRQEDEEEIQTKPLAASITPLIQRQEDEEEIQTKPLAASITPLIQRQEDEEEIQTKPLAASIMTLVQRQEDEEEIQTSRASQPPQAAPTSGSFSPDSRFETSLAATRGSGQPLPGETRQFMETRFGADFSGVRLHTGAESAALNRQVSAQAFTQGQDIYLGAGGFDSGSSAGKRLLAHELTHVVQQQPGVVRKTLPGPAGKLVQRVAGRQLPGTIQRVAYAALNPMSQERVNQLSDEKYYEKAQEFEYNMSAKILADARLDAAVNQLVARVQAIVNAWAASTGRDQGATYEREFTWAGGDDYYGAFLTSAANITDIFAHPDAQPIRTKLKLVYNAVRNNNLSKWLKIAAIELYNQAKGKKAVPLKIKTAARGIVTQRDANRKVKAVRQGVAEKEEVQPGFAAAAGFDNVSMPLAQQKEFSEIAAREKTTEHFTSKRDVFAHDITSDVVGWKPTMKEANKERVGSGVNPTEQRTLTTTDVPDLTDAEVAQIYVMQQKPVPDHAECDRFRSDPLAKTGWSQGGETLDVVLGEACSREASRFKARMEAGISGSTDLMIHAIQNLGLGNDPNLMRKFRLALAGWMLANRDHSFYEIYKSAAEYGIPFDNPNDQPGHMYESDINLYPMVQADFQDTLPENVFPAYFLTDAYKDIVANTLPEARFQEARWKNQLKERGVPTNVADALDKRGVAELKRLSELVEAQAIDVGESLAKRRYIVRQLQHHSTFVYLANTLGLKPAKAILDAMLNALHVGKGLVPEGTSAKDTLADAGLERSVLDMLAQPQLDALINAYRVVRAARPDATTGVIADMTGIDTAFDKLQMALVPKAICDKFKRVLLQTFHGTRAIPTVGDQTAAAHDRRRAQIERIAQLGRPPAKRWYSWGNRAYLKNYVDHLPTIRNYAPTAFHSPQGYGLYLATTINETAQYGANAGGGVAFARLENTPTLIYNNATQQKACERLPYKGRNIDLSTNDLWEDQTPVQNYVSMFFIYNTSPWGRLTTNVGVTLNMNLKKEDPAELKAFYGQITDVAAKANFKTQARDSGVNVSKWV